MKGDRTRKSILDRAVDLASLEGLEGLTIGRLADDLEMSKSGLFAHFGSKEDLQIATIEAARERFRNEVFAPALREPRGLPRLRAICREWLNYVQREVFPGGCFFAAASFEFDGRPGPVREAIKAAMDDWQLALRKAVELAKEEAHLSPETDAAQLAFELNAFFFGANFAMQLHTDGEAVKRAERAIEARLESYTVSQGSARTSPNRGNALSRSA
jgi:AcrR family transcriptional regulator